MPVRGDIAAVSGILSVRDPLSANLAVLIAPFRAENLAFGAMQPAAVVTFADPDAHPAPSPAAIAEAFGLTPAESRLVAALVRGGTLVEAAKRNGVTINTAKTQLASVFLKTGCQRQADLIAGVLAARPAALDHGALKQRAQRRLPKALAGRRAGFFPGRRHTERAAGPFPPQPPGSCRSAPVYWRPRRRCRCHTTASPFEAPARTT